MYGTSGSVGGMYPEELRTRLTNLVVSILGVPEPVVELATDAELELLSRRSEIAIVPPLQRVPPVSPKASFDEFLSWVCRRVNVSPYELSSAHWSVARDWARAALEVELSVLSRAEAREAYAPSPELTITTAPDDEAYPAWELYHRPYHSLVPQSIADVGLANARQKEQESLRRHRSSPALGRKTHSPRFSRSNPSATPHSAVYARPRPVTPHPNYRSTYRDSAPHYANFRSDFTHTPAPGYSLTNPNPEPAKLTRRHSDVAGSVQRRARAPAQHPPGANGAPVVPAPPAPTATPAPSISQATVHRTTRSKNRIGPTQHMSALPAATSPRPMVPTTSHHGERGTHAAAHHRAEASKPTPRGYTHEGPHTPAPPSAWRSGGTLRRAATTPLPRQRRTPHAAAPQVEAAGRTAGMATAPPAAPSPSPPPPPALSKRHGERTYGADIARGVSGGSPGVGRVRTAEARTPRGWSEEVEERVRRGGGVPLPPRHVRALLERSIREPDAEFTAEERASMDALLRADPEARAKTVQATQSALEERMQKRQVRFKTPVRSAAMPVRHPVVAGTTISAAK